MKILDTEKFILQFDALEIWLITEALKAGIAACDDKSTGDGFERLRGDLRGLMDNVYNRLVDEDTLKMKRADRKRRRERPGALFGVWGREDREPGGEYG